MSDLTTPEGIPQPILHPDPGRREIRMEIEVPGTVEEVWQAIATGPGISSWYVPHTVEERPGGAATARFGPGPEMEVPGRVEVWDPPHRIVFAGVDAAPGLAFEWVVEARGQGSSIVRLVNSGFGTGEPWDDQYDDMIGGWTLFLRNLWLHLRYFPGLVASAAIPMGMWPGNPAASWPDLLKALGLPEAPAIGSRVATYGSGVPPLAGTVLDAGRNSLALLLDEPAPGTGLLAAEGGGDACAVSVWAYLYGADADERAQAHTNAWGAWLATPR
ncbi:MAG: SRPBCC domain-containing protein [Austwickia sp.]|nr:MAG: SRPBCC domain-containing protein [Austwickia sp.]